jgi:hypothetical protein
MFGDKHNRSVYTYLSTPYKSLQASVSIFIRTHDPSMGPEKSS